MNVPSHIRCTASMIRPSWKSAGSTCLSYDKISVKNSQTHSVTENSKPVTPTLRKEDITMHDR